VTRDLHESYLSIQSHLKYFLVESQELSSHFESLVASSSQRRVKCKSIFFLPFVYKMVSNAEPSPDSLQQWGLTL